MVHHPVAEGRRADQALLGFVNVEVVVAARLVGLLLQLILQAEQVAFQVELEAGHFRAAALAFAGGAEGPIQVSEGAQPG